VWSVQTTHTQVGWIGLAISRAPIANGRGYDPWSSSKSFCVYSSTKTGWQVRFNSHSSISRALWCLRGPVYIHCGYNRDGYN